MKRLTLILFFAVLSSVSYSQTSLPNIFVKTINGKETTLLSLTKGEKPVLVAFWATWCNPCIEELDMLAEYYEDWKKEVDFEILAICIDDTRSVGKAKSVVSGKSWPFIVILDQNQEVMKAMNVSLVPFCFVLDRNKEVKYRHSGYVPGDEVNLLKEIKKIANEKRSIN